MHKDGDPPSDKQTPPHHRHYLLGRPVNIGPAPPRFGQSQAYVHALAKAGAASVLIPPLTDKTLLRTIYDLLDSLLLAGGEDVASGLIVAARAPDKIVEAVEVEGHPFAIGVQWHPEELADNDVRAQRIFSALVEACQGEKSCCWSTAA